MRLCGTSAMPARVSVRVLVFAKRVYIALRQIPPVLAYQFAHRLTIHQPNNQTRLYISDCFS